MWRVSVSRCSKFRHYRLASTPCIATMTYRPVLRLTLDTNTWKNPQIQHNSSTFCLNSLGVCVTKYLIGEGFTWSQNTFDMIWMYNILQCTTWVLLPLYTCVQQEEHSGLSQKHIPTKKSLLLISDRQQNRQKPNRGLVLKSHSPDCYQTFLHLEQLTDWRHSCDQP